MTNEDVLRKAIEKAEANGFDITLVGDIQPYQDYRDANYIIFSHWFAEAFTRYIIETKQVNKISGLLGSESFYDKKLRSGFEYDVKKEFLQQLALAEDRLEYLKKFL